MTHLDSERGFTLIESMIVVCVFLMIVTASLGLYVNHLRNHRAINSLSEVAQDGLAVTDYFMTQVHNVGGGVVQSWIAIWVEDDCGARGPLPTCQDSDRLTMINVPDESDPIQENLILGHVGAPAASTRLRLELSSATCNANKYLNRHIVLAYETEFSHRYVTAADMGTCEIQIEEARQMIGRPQASPTRDWTGGTVTLVDLRTVYWQGDKLWTFSDANNNGAMDVGEQTEMADRIFDFQVAIGYDFAPADAWIDVSAADPSTDEVMYNAPGVAEQIGAGHFAGINGSELLSVFVGIIVGNEIHVEPFKRKASVLNGPERERVDYNLRTWRFSVIPRNRPSL